MSRADRAARCSPRRRSRPTIPTAVLQHLLDRILARRPRARREWRRSASDRMASPGSDHVRRVQSTVSSAAVCRLDVAYAIGTRPDPRHPRRIRAKSRPVCAAYPFLPLIWRFRVSGRRDVGGASLLRRGNGRWPNEKSPAVSRASQAAFREDGLEPVEDLVGPEALQPLQRAVQVAGNPPSAMPPTFSIDRMWRL